MKKEKTISVKLTEAELEMVLGTAGQMDNDIEDYYWEEGKPGVEDIARMNYDNGMDKLREGLHILREKKIKKGVGG